MAIWKCPRCGAEKQVVCPVCGFEKRAGETCGYCGSEFSFTLCPKCGYEQRYR